MFGIGMPELILILAVALIVIGPKKLPDLARSVGRALGEFKKATNELKSSMGVDEELNDVKSAFDKMNNEVREIQDSVTGKPPASSPPKADGDDAQDAKAPGTETDAGTPADPADDPLDTLSQLNKSFDQLNEKSDPADTDPPAATPSPKDPAVHG